jgi:hypothetical protein
MSCIVANGVGGVCSKAIPLRHRYSLSTLRVSAIVGAQTLYHTDSFCGRTDNYLLCHGTGCKLRVYNFPHFHCCVVSLKGHLFIPMGYSERNQSLRMYSIDPSDDSKVMKFEFLYVDKFLCNLHPVGRLPFVVVGIKDGALPIDNSPHPFPSIGTIARPSDYQSISLKMAIQIARKPINVFTTSHKTYYDTGEMDKWTSFPAWMLRHEFVGNNPMCPRTQVFFRLLRQLPTGSNYIRSGKCNFVSLDIADLEVNNSTIEGNTVFTFLCSRRSETTLLPFTLMLHGTTSLQPVPAALSGNAPLMPSQSVSAHFGTSHPTHATVHGTAHPIIHGTAHPIVHEPRCIPLIRQYMEPHIRLFMEPRRQS